MFLLLFLWAVVLADIALIAPAMNDTFYSESERVTIELQWIDDNSTPKVNDIDHFAIGLVTGPNDNITMVNILEKKVFIEDTTKSKDSWSYSVHIDDTSCSNGIYYIQITSIFGNTKKYTIHYSQKFNLEGMKVANTTLDHGKMEYPPPPDTTGHSTGTTTNLDSYFTIPYSKQHGSARYAPMQQLVESKWKTGRWKQFWKPSTKHPFKTLGHKPDAQYTITQPPSYTLTTGINTFPPVVTKQHHYHPKEKIKWPYLRSTSSSSSSS